MSARPADASDRLSPILVKELRQGVRGHVFTGAFLLQVLMLLAVASLGILADVNPGNREVFSFFFWAFVTLPLVLILPLGAAASVSGELAANTFEPLLLTRLTPWRLVAGKWAAVASQALVLAVAALPFVLVRYYLGAVEIVSDVAFLAAYVGCSLLLTSMAIALSPARLSPLFRWLVTGVGTLFLGITFMSMLGRAVFQRMYVVHSGGSLSVWPSTLAFLAVTAIGVLAGLEAGALQIAPAASARPLRLRVMGLASLGATAALSLLLPPNDFRAVAIAWAVGLAGLITLSALCERAPLLRARYAGFYRRRILIPFAWFLAPGWPAGVGYFLLVAASAAVAVWLHEGFTAAVFVLGGLLGSLLLPVVVWRTLVPNAGGFLTLLLVSFASGGFSMVAPIALGMESTTLASAGWLLLPLCPIAYATARLGWVDGYGIAPTARLALAADVVFAAFVSAVVLAALGLTVREWRRIGRRVRERPAA